MDQKRKRRAGYLPALAILLGAGVATMGMEPVPGRSRPGKEWPGIARVLDLTYAISEDSPAWPGDTRPFEARISTRAEQAGYFSRSFSMLEHFGTHLDAPVHFPPGRTPVDAIPVERLLGPAVVIDVRGPVAANPDYRIGVEDVLAWEGRHGRIPAGAIVLARTGWAARWPNERRYRNMDAQGVMHFPGYSVEAVQLLIERRVSGLGIDTLSIDYGPSQDFEAHRVSHGADLYHQENLADLSALPEAGAYVVAAPLKLAGGSGGPVRVFALLPE